MVKEMACPSDTNNGFVQITDVITQSNLNGIIGSKDRRPFTMSLKPTSTIPKLIGNKIVEDNATENTFTLQGNRFSLLDIQICQVLHNGYLLPGQTEKPVYELILTCKGSSLPDNPFAAMLLCFPIYRANTPSHGEYLTQLITQSLPSCKFENKIGFEYGGKDYKVLKDQSIAECVSSCCTDPNCKTYNYKNSTCFLKNSIPEIKRTANETIAGKVDHSTFNPVIASSSCSLKTSSEDGTTTNIHHLESLFYSSKEDISQTSFSYKTCFEIANAKDVVSNKNLVVFVFPRGIRLTDATIEQLLLQLNYKIPSYQIPSLIRDNQNTMLTYQFGSLGRKTFRKQDQSKNGSVYTMQLSSCSSEFTNRFEYFLLPPKSPFVSNDLSVSGENNSSLTSASTSASASASASAASSSYKTNQYKCVPLNQLTDISNGYVIKGNKSLETILKEQEQLKKEQQEGYSRNNPKQSITTDQIETFVALTAGVTIGAFVVVGLGGWISKIFNK
jgi:hypothetical protein